MKAFNLSKLSLVIATLLVSVLIVDSAFAAGRGRSGGGGRGGSGHSHHHHRHFIGASSGIFVSSWYFPGYYAGYYPGYAYLQPPPVSYYIERGDDDNAGTSWFFCPAANAYFPAVIECPTEWQRVPAQP